MMCPLKGRVPEKLKIKKPPTPFLPDLAKKSYPEIREFDSPGSPTTTTFTCEFCIKHHSVGIGSSLPPTMRGVDPSHLHRARIGAALPHATT